MKTNRLYTIVKKRIATEKSVRNEGLNTYTFEVCLDASKPEIKAAIEQIYTVKVKKVATLTQKPVEKHFRMRKGVEKAVKKAYVVLCPGENIDFHKGFSALQEK